MSFIDLDKIEYLDLLPGVRIRAPYGQNLMLSMVELEAGAVVPLHSHPHEQGGILLEGRMELTIGSETRLLEPGAIYIIPPGLPHKAVAVGGPARALDVFSPVREDYAQGSNLYVQAGESRE